MKLEVGMYVRINANVREICIGIGKIKNIFQNTIYVEMNGISLPVSFQVNEISNASLKITDLIGEGDLVEIEFYSSRYEKRITRLFEVDFKDNGHITFNNAHCQLYILNGSWSNEDASLEPIFKSVITKEQFENAKYRIGDE